MGYIKKLILYIFVLFCIFLNIQYTNAANCATGIKLNTHVPFVTDGSTCLAKEDSKSVFPKLMGGMSKLLMNIIMIVAFLMIVAAGVMMSMYGFNQGAHSKGKQLLMKVVIGIALLGLSGIILHLINPNFFSGG